MTQTSIRQRRTGWRYRVQVQLIGCVFACALAACGGGGGGGGSSGSASGSGTGSGSIPPPTPQPIDTADASRLLDQAAFGPTDADVASVKSLGAAGWIDAQIATPSTGYTALPFADSNTTIGCPTGSVNTCYRDTYSPFKVQLQFFRNAVSGKDQLRQRVAMAYSQIFVAAGTDNMPVYAMREYEQMLLDNAFVNYRTLLQNVTLHPTMGAYLNMANNAKANVSAGTSPNENYGREVLQLFSLGPNQLNADGSNVLSGGLPVPTYSQLTVQNFAAAFTGWTYAPIPGGAASKWNNPRYFIGQMVPFATYHDETAKTLLNGATVPANQTPAQDLSAAMDSIFNHPNAGPFIGKQMIQFLVTSNPSPAYVARITAVFNNNGAGVRGDMGAVIKAILLDSEARGDAVTDPSFGKLREPAQFEANLLRAFGATTDGEYPNSQASAMSQGMFDAPSVFNFYEPSYALPGSSTLVGPQFGIENTSTLINRLNSVQQLLYSTNGIAADTSVAGSTGTKINAAAFQTLAADPVALVGRLNSLMVHSTMTAAELTAVQNVVAGIAATDTLDRFRVAAFLVALSPRYQIVR